MPGDRQLLELPERKADPERRSFLLRSATILYSFMAAFSFAWAFIREDLDIFNHPEPPYAFPWHAGLWGGLMAGVVFGCIIVWLSKLVVRRTTWARKLLVEMKSILGRLTWTESLFLAALSALCEEILFRGILQAHLGLVLSSLIFGLAHLPRNRTLIPWTIQATLLGFCLGLLFLYTGNLIAPVAAHFVINFRNLNFIRKYPPIDERGGGGTND